MISLHPYKSCAQSRFLFNTSKLRNYRETQTRLIAPRKAAHRRLVKCSSGQEGEKKPERRTFLTLEEAGLVEISGLTTHERFLCRLTVSLLSSLRGYICIYIVWLNIVSESFSLMSFHVIWCRYRPWIYWGWYQSKKGVQSRSSMLAKYVIGSLRTSSKGSRIWSPQFFNGMIPSFNFNSFSFAF